MTYNAGDVESFDTVESIQTSKIQVESATIFGDRILGTRDNGNGIREWATFDVDALGGGAGSSNRGIESAAITGGVASLLATPDGPIVGITQDGVALFEDVHFSLSGRTITVLTGGTPVVPLVRDGNCTWIYGLDSNPTQVVATKTVTGGMAILDSIPATPVVGVHQNGTVIRSDTHFTIDGLGQITILTYGTPPQPYVPDGDVTWIYSTDVLVGSPPAPSAARTTLEIDTGESTVIDTVTVELAVILSTNLDDTFTLTGTRRITIRNDSIESKTVGGVSISGLSTAELGYWSSAWRTL